MHPALPHAPQPSESETASTLYWNLQEPAHTHYLNALSLLLPGAEQFMMDTCKDVLNDTHLRKQLSAPLIDSIEIFMQEEQAHQQAHVRYNRRLTESGYNLFAQQNKISEVFSDLKTLPLMQRICLMNGFECLTAHLARRITERPRLLTRHPTPQSRLWHWHCQEEIAHQPVVTQLVEALRIPTYRLKGWTVLSALWIYSDMRSLVSALRRQDIAQGRLTHLRWLTSTARMAMALVKQDGTA